QVVPGPDRRITATRIPHYLRARGGSKNGIENGAERDMAGLDIRQNGESVGFPSGAVEKNQQQSRTYAREDSGPLVHCASRCSSILYQARASCELSYGRSVRHRTPARKTHIGSMGQPSRPNLGTLRSSQCLIRACSKYAG